MRRAIAASRAADTTMIGTVGQSGAQQGQAGQAVHAGHVEVEQQRVGLGLALERRLDFGQAAGQG